MSFASQAKANAGASSAGVDVSGIHLFQFELAIAFDSMKGGSTMAAVSFGAAHQPQHAPCTDVRAAAQTPVCAHSDDVLLPHGANLSMSEQVAEAVVTERLQKVQKEEQQFKLYTHALATLLDHIQTGKDTTLQLDSGDSSSSSDDEIQAGGTDAGVGQDKGHWTRVLQRLGWYRRPRHLKPDYMSASGQVSSHFCTHISMFPTHYFIMSLEGSGGTARGDPASCESVEAAVQPGTHFQLR